MKYFLALMMCLVSVSSQALWCTVDFSKPNSIPPQSKVGHTYQVYANCIEDNPYVFIPIGNILTNIKHNCRHPMLPGETCVYTADFTPIRAGEHRISIWGRYGAINLRVWLFQIFTTYAS